MAVGAWSLLPPLVAIGLAIATRRVHQSLLAGLFIAGILAAWDTSSGAWRLFAARGGGAIQSIDWLVGAVADRGNAGIFVFLAILAAIVAVMQRAGAVRAFGESAMQVASTPSRMQGLAWLVGVTVLAIDDHFNVIASGTIFRPVADRVGVSRAKLAYVIDSTGSPVAIINPISTWAGFMAAFAAGALAAAGVAASGFGTLLRSIPFNFYAWATLLFVLLVAMGRIEFGPMRRAEGMARAEHRGKPSAQLGDTRSTRGDGAEPSTGETMHGEPTGPWHLLGPLLFLVAATIAMLYITGRGEAAGVGAAFRNADPPLALSISTALTLAVAVIWYRARGLLPAGRWAETGLEGIKTMVPAFAILALAFSLGDAIVAIGLPEWTASALGGEIPVTWLPLAAFLVSAGISFSTGTSFGTYAITIPLTIGITAQSPDAAAWFAPVLGATAGGGVFGDHCSPISDTTVLSSMAAGCDHIQHVQTQLPYALSCAALAALGYTALGLGAPLWLAAVVPFALLAAIAVRPAASLGVGGAAVRD